MASNQWINFFNGIKASGVNVVLFAMGAICYGGLRIGWLGIITMILAILLTLIYGILGIFGILKKEEMIIIVPKKIDFNKKEVK